MCEICKVEPGNYEVLANDEVDCVIGRRKMVSHLLCFGISCDMDGTYTLDSDYFVDGGDSVAHVKVPITYCPFCGRELPHYEETDYPWST